MVVAEPIPETHSKELYEHSKTFLSKTPAREVIWLRIGTVGLILTLFYIAIPIMNSAGAVPDYKLNFLGKYLCFCMVGLGIDLIWGYTGILSLSQALFFCIGGYAMAMHLSLPQGGGDVRPEYNNIPQFMFFNNVRQLPFFWKPFQSLTFSLLAGIGLPALVASCFGFFVFRSRVRGVYFSIITQALAWGSWLLVSRNEMLLGGTNGLTNFYKPLTEQRSYIRASYLLTLTVLVLSYLLCRAITKSKLGRVLIAIRDKETRLYFAGYRPYAFKVFAFAVGAALAGIGGMLYSPQVTIISPHNMRVEESILMVIWVALGGRGRLWGAIFGTLLVSYMYAALTSDMPSAWPFIEGGMFLAVVLILPEGIVGLWDELERGVTSYGFSQAGLVRYSCIIIALLVLSLFVMGEALGIMPGWLQTVVIHSDRLANVQVKYLGLVIILLVCGVWRRLVHSSLAVRG